MKYWETIQEKVGLKAEDIDVCNVTLREQNFTVNYDSFTNPTHPRHAEANFYTDGSKMSDNVGATFVLYEIHRKIKEDKFLLPKSCTVFQAEDGIRDHA